jgi:hypothetical protein
MPLSGAGYPTRQAASVHTTCKRTIPSATHPGFVPWIGRFRGAIKHLGEPGVAAGSRSRAIFSANPTRASVVWRARGYSGSAAARRRPPIAEAFRRTATGVANVKPKFFGRAFAICSRESSGAQITGSIRAVSVNV